MTTQSFIEHTESFFEYNSSSDWWVMFSSSAFSILSATLDQGQVSNNAGVAKAHTLVFHPFPRHQTFSTLYPTLHMNALISKKQTVAC